MLINKKTIVNIIVFWMLFNLLYFINTIEFNIFGSKRRN